MFTKNSNGTYKNNVQQYIDAYQTKLQNILGKNKVTARIPVCKINGGTYSYSTNGISPYDICEKTVTNEMRNPSKASQYYWLGTTGQSWAGLYYVNNSGIRTNTVEYHKKYMGVRPTVIFKK